MTTGEQPGTGPIVITGLKNVAGIRAAAISDGVLARRPSMSRNLRVIAPLARGVISCAAKSEQDFEVLPIDFSNQDL